MGTDIYVDSDDFQEIQSIKPDMTWITPQFTTYIRYNNKGYWYVVGTEFNPKRKQISLGKSITEEKLNNLLIEYNIR